VSEEESFRQLIQRVRAGEREAAAELVRLYEPEIRRFIRTQLNRSRLRRTFDSADIFQSVFLNFYVRVMDGQFDLEEPTQLLRLLATMARNRITDHARKPSARAQDGGPDLWANVAAEGASPSDVVAEEEILQQVLRRLTAEERDLAQKRHEGRSWQELADECGSTADALRKKLDRALGRLCQELNPDGGGDA
jgi:RNA polymerase sigma-70 factor (ECF subfamily)